MFFSQSWQVQNVHWYSFRDIILATKGGKEAGRDHSCLLPNSNLQRLRSENSTAWPAWLCLLWPFGGGYNDDGGMQSTHTERFHCRHACCIKRFMIYGNWFGIHTCPWIFMISYVVSLECRNGSKCPLSVRSSAVWVCVSQRFFDSSASQVQTTLPWSRELLRIFHPLEFSFGLCSHSKRIGITRRL